MIPGGTLTIDDPRFEYLQTGMVTVVGIPFDENSSFMRGSALAPARIREILHSNSTNLCSENGTDLSVEPRFRDLGNLELPGGTAAFEQIEKIITKLLECDVHVLSLGGDHTITYPIMKAYEKKYNNLNILHLDAHPDLYDEFEGNRLSHACPFARIMEEKLVSRLVQMGVRATTPHQRTQAERFGVEIIEMRNWQHEVNIDFKGPVYLSLDMDVLDPAFAPGVSHQEPGGPSTREVLQLIQSLQAQIIGADIVEFNPKRDPLEITAMAAVKFLKEITACMLELENTSKK